MKEHRKEGRRDCLVPVEAQDGSLFDCVRTMDVSKGGMGLISSREIPLNKEVTIQLDLGFSDEPVFVVGKVKWVRPMDGSPNYRVGIAFDSVMRGSKSRLERYFK